jgi:sterol desaturase/sphingolipid hydroxylase (fatty acid hydroxylase superfamily)
MLKKGQVGVWDFAKVHEKIVYGNVHSCIVNNMRLVISMEPYPLSLSLSLYIYIYIHIYICAHTHTHKVKWLISIHILTGSNL